MVIVCPHCSQKMRGPANNVGATARCPKCGKSFVVERPHPPARSPAADPPVIEGVPIDTSNWVQFDEPRTDGLGKVKPSRRDQSASLLDDMAQGAQPAPSHKTHDWYVVVTDFELDGPYTGQEIVSAIRVGKFTPETRLQRDQTRTTVAELAKRLNAQMKASP